MKNKSKYFVFATLLLFSACSDKSKDSFGLGKIAYDSGRYVQAKTFFMQVDSLSQWSSEARIYVRRIDSLLVAGDLLKSDVLDNSTSLAASGAEEEYFFMGQLDSSQYQLIDKTCAIYFLSPEERSDQQSSEIAEMQRQDSIYMAEHPEDTDFSGSTPDDIVWYGYVYQSQFRSIENLGIPTVRNKGRQYLRFVDQNNNTVTVDLNKQFCSGEECIILFKMGKMPDCNCNDEEGKRAIEYFTLN